MCAPPAPRRPLWGLSETKEGEGGGFCLHPSQTLPDYRHGKIRARIHRSALYGAENFMRCMLMIAPYRARVQYSAVTTASPFLHLSTTLGIPPPQSRAIREHHGHRRPSTPVHGRGHPSTAVTAVHGRQQLFISVHGRHGCPWPSTAVTAVHGHHCRPWLPTAVTAAHGCRPAG